MEQLVHTKNNFLACPLRLMGQCILNALASPLKFQRLLPVALNLEEDQVFVPSVYDISPIDKMALEPS